MKAIRRVFIHCCAAIVLCGFATLATAATSAVERAKAQLQQGDSGAALQTLDDYLATAPRDANARFTRGLVLVKLNRPQEAINVFSALTRDFPTLLEPYNNLAALYAQQGDYEKARDVLETVLAIQPDYAPAHENLGDVYAAMAAQAYAHALTLTPDSAALRFKQAVISQLSTGPATGNPAKPPPALPKP